MGSRVIFIEMTREPGFAIHWLGPRAHTVAGDVKILADYLISYNGVTWPVISDDSGFIPVPTLERT